MQHLPSSPKPAFVVLLVLFAAPAPAQNPAAPPPAVLAPAPEASATVPVSEIPGRLQQTAAVIRRANSHAQPLGSVLEIERALPRFQEGTQSLLAATRELLKLQISPGSAREFKNGWAIIGRRLSGWQEILKNRSSSLQQDLEALSVESKGWRLTQEATAVQQLPEDLRSEIARTLESIGKSEQAVLTRRNAILKLQGELSRLDIDLEEMDELLNEALSAGRGKLLRIDAPPIWRPAPKVDDSTASVDFELGPVETAPAVLRYYLLSILEFVGVELLVFAFLVAFLFSLRKKAELCWQDEDESVRGLAFAIRRPFSTAILLTAVVGAFWNSAVPEYLLNLGWYAVLLPLCRVIPNLAAPGLRPFIWALAGLYVADGTLALLPAHSTVVRLLVVLLAAAAGAGLVLYQRRLRVVEFGNGWRQFARFGVGAGIALLAIAVVSEVIGATALSRYLAGGVLRSVYAAAALYGCLSILRGFIQVVFRSFRRRKDSSWRMPAELQLTMLHGLTWLAFVLYLTVVLRAFQFWDPLLVWARRILQYHVSIGALGFTIGSAFTFLAVLLGAILLSRVLRFFFAAGLQGRIDLQRGTSEAVSKLAHYAILTAGFLLALGASGIDLNKVTVLAGALGVGVGFGMQNIVNNFVSGLILLFERPLHVGDQITVGSTSGEVADIGIRASVIRTWDGADVIIPNASLISGDVTNWTHSDGRRRGELRVGVAYGTDPGLIIRALTEAALSHPQVLRDPSPTAHLIDFGDSSLDFVLRYWTRLEHHLDTGSQIHTAVYQRLTEEGIEIPFPQRQVHFQPMGICPEVRQSTQNPASLPETDSAR